jgi:hypothetical protein
MAMLLRNGKTLQEVEDDDTGIGLGQTLHPAKEILPDLRVDTGAPDFDNLEHAVISAESTLEEKVHIPKRRRLRASRLLHVKLEAYSFEPAETFIIGNVVVGRLMFDHVFPIYYAGPGWVDVACVTSIQISGIPNNSNDIRVVFSSSDTVYTETSQPVSNTDRIGLEFWSCITTTNPLNSIVCSIPLVRQRFWLHSLLNDRTADTFVKFSITRCKMSVEDYFEKFQRNDGDMDYFNSRFDWAGRWSRLGFQRNSTVTTNTGSEVYQARAELR